MRLCYVIHQFLPWASSGTEQYCLATAREARRRGDDVTILSLHWDHERTEPPIRVHDEPYDGFRVLRLNHGRVVNPNDVLRDYENLHLEGWFARILAQIAPDAVHFFHLRQLGSNLIPIAKAGGARVVLSLTDFWFLCPRFTMLRSDGHLCAGPIDHGRACIPCHAPELAGVAPSTTPAESTNTPADRARALLDRPARQRANFRVADAVFAPSRFLADAFAANGLTHDGLLVQPYGLDPHRITPIPTERPRSPLRLAFCGVLSPWKAPRLVVESLRHVQAPVRLAIHGNLDEGMFADYIATLRTAAASDPRVELRGPYDAERAAQVFADMDVLVVPSLWYENTPFVVLEAFAAGVPVVASDLGGLTEVVRNGIDGRLFRAGDAEALGAVLQELAANPDSLRSLRPSSPNGIAVDYEAFARAYRHPEPVASSAPRS